MGNFDTQDMLAKLKVLTEAGIEVDTSVYRETMLARCDEGRWHSASCSTRPADTTTDYHEVEIVDIMENLDSCCLIASEPDSNPVWRISSEIAVHFHCISAVNIQKESERLRARNVIRDSPEKYITTHHTYGNPPSSSASKLMADTLQWLKDRATSWAQWSNTPEGLLFLEKEAVCARLFGEDEEYRRHISSKQFKEFWSKDYTFLDIPEDVLPEMSPAALLSARQKMKRGPAAIIFSKLIQTVREESNQRVLAYIPKPSDAYRDRSSLVMTLQARYPSKGGMVVLPASLKYLSGIKEFARLEDSDSPTVIETASELFASQNHLNLNLALELARAV